MNSTDNNISTTTLLDSDTKNIQNETLESNKIKEIVADDKLKETKEKEEEEEEEDDEEEFDWNDYLKKTKSEAAPDEYFCQNTKSPPQNEFKVGHKLETHDPRNTSSTCIATVIEIAGSRIRLRLDGTDDRNDFWLMCDSDLIHPFEYSAKHGRKIQPPLGYGNDLSKWPKFLEKIINTAQAGQSGTNNNNNSMFAPESCFKQPPTRPLKNEFKIGQKLEAVDPKNPHLICPATIKDINRDKLFVSFDGWSQSSQFWVSYSSRDLFPVGWCKKTSHVLQHPGNLEEKQQKQRERSQSFRTTTAITTTKKKESNKQTEIECSTSMSTSSLSSSSNSVNNSALNLTIENNNISLVTNNAVNLTANPSSQVLTSLNNNSNSNTTKTNKQQQNRKLSSSNDMSQKESKRSESRKKSTNSEKFDLSLVKCEATEPIIPSNIFEQSSTSSNKNNLNSKCEKKSNSLVVVYVNSNYDCGKYINSNLFHKAHTKFGPGQVCSVYKSILQSFVDSAVNRYEVFKLLPEGTSKEIICFKNSSHSEKKKIIRVSNAKEMWQQLKIVCNILSIDDSKLFSNQIIPKQSPKVENKENTTNQQEQQEQQHNLVSSTSSPPLSLAPAPTTCIQSSNITNDSSPTIPLVSIPATIMSNKIANYSLPLTPQPSSSSCSSSSSSSSSSTLCTNGQQQHGHTTTNKRRLSSIDNNTLVTSSYQHQQQLNSLKNDFDLNSNVDSMPSRSAKCNKLDSNLNFSLQNQNQTLPITEWSIEQVVSYIQSLGDYFSSHVDAFKHHEIDGKALLLLTTDILMKYMGFKLGPALKLNNYLDKLRQQQNQSSTISSPPKPITTITTKTECTNYY